MRIRSSDSNAHQIPSIAFFLLKHTGIRLLRTYWYHLFFDFNPDPDSDFDPD
jgi:hypothetical protein